ncbi:NAD(P)H-binding protein [Actinophytocola sp.]|uniref:NAD(P)H-binding protein n=1 Tax=Actinophytocola sp. TaxID=1872138 RepID=UPI00389A2B4F
MTILVIGATGNIGRHVVTGLRARGAAVRTLSRFPGRETVTGDLTEPETLDPALSGVDTVFLLWPFMSAQGAPAVLDVIARHARRVVYVSALSVRDDRPAEENGVWGQVEAAIRASGLEWTFLRPGGFATNTLGWAPAIRAGEPVRMPYPRAARSLIHERDIADVAVLALTEEGHTGRTYRLTGPEVLTQAEQARILGAVAGRPAVVEEIGAEEARADVLAWADEAHADAVLAYWRGLVDNPEPVTPTVEELTGHPARTFTRWALDHADDVRPLPAAEVAERYVAAFRAGRLDQALRWAAPDLVRVAPLENDGKHVELRGLADITANAERLNHDRRIHAVDVDGPYVRGDRFAVRFTFDETHTPTGQRTSTTKLSLYTVVDGVLSREEVYYFDAPPAG